MSLFWEGGFQNANFGFMKFVKSWEKVVLSDFVEKWVKKAKIGDFENQWFLKLIEEIWGFARKSEFSATYNWTHSSSRGFGAGWRSLRWSFDCLNTCALLHRRRVEFGVVSGTLVALPAWYRRESSWSLACLWTWLGALRDHFASKDW